jgi:hypothetical protein
MFAKLFVLTLSVFTSTLTIAADTNQLSLVDRQRIAGTLYLGQCVFKSNDYRELGSLLDKKNVREVKRNELELQLIDEWAMTRITLRKEACLVEIASKEMDKIAQSLYEVLPHTRGKFSLTKIIKGHWGKPGYRGNLYHEGRKIEIKVDEAPTKDAIVMIALLNN